MFKLTDYTEEIQAIAETNNCTATAAVDLMIVNLNTFKTHYKGTGKINYHQLGQLWCNLTSAQKVAQKNETKQLVSKPVPMRGTRRRV